MLTRIMWVVIDDYNPSTCQERRVRLRYAHVGGYNLPLNGYHSKAR